MTEFVSKQVQIHRPEKEVFDTLSDFGHFTPIVKDRLEEWEATSEACSFKLYGMRMALAIVEKEPYRTIKLTGDNMPFEFFFWIQLKGMEATETRMRLTVHARLNPVMKMMVGSKLQEGIDKLAEHIAAAFNGGR